MSQVIHNPFGKEHPYEQMAEERFPREPMAGDPFVVGIVTRPPGSVRRVTVHTSVSGQDGPTVEAERQVGWQPELEDGVGAELIERRIVVDQDVWQAKLVAPDMGQILSYWIEVDGQIGPSYSLQGRAWQPISTTIVAKRGEPGQWRMHISPGQSVGELPDDTGLPGLLGTEWLTDGATRDRVRFQFECTPEESFFGLGERFNSLDQRGEIMDVRCYEQYKNQGKRTYMPVPFLLSSEGYGLFVDSNRWMQFDLAASEPDRWILEAELGPDETLDLVWFTGDDPLDIVGRFTLFAGKPALPPLWAFGLWMSSNEWNSQARVMREVEQSEAHGISPSVLVIEAWSDETTFYIWNDAQYMPAAGNRSLQYADFNFPEDGKWPDPKSMVDDLHQRGLKVLLWQVPVFKAVEEPHAQHDADRKHFEQGGFGVRETDGDLHRVRPFWFRGGYIWDVTNPEAREWWLGKRAYLLDEVGIDGFKTDGGEHLWGRHTGFHDGRQGDELWNLYPRLYSEAYYQFANKHRGGDAIVFSRAGFTGSQTSPVHWAGDENSTWEAFRHSVLAGLSAGISGIPFWGWDLAGFSGEIPTAELYLRSLAMAAFCPIMQYHSEFNQHREPCVDRTPWNIQARTGDERVIPAFRCYVNVRHNLMPYIWQEAQYAVETGQPMMRALSLHYPNASPFQYLFGRDLLVCPVVEEGVSTWSVYLPDGDWIDFWTHERYSGDQTIEVVVPIDRIPVFARAGTTIPVFLGPSKQLSEYVPLSSSANDALHFG